MHMGLCCGTGFKAEEDALWFVLQERPRDEAGRTLLWSMSQCRRQRIHSSLCCGVGRVATEHIHLDYYGMRCSTSCEIGQAIVCVVTQALL